MKPVHFAKSETDPFFNTEAAQKSYELVMKMDDDEARFFCTAVVSDVLDEQIAKNLRSIQSRVDEVAADIFKRAKHTVSKTLVAKRMNDEPFDEENALATAGALAVIEKASFANQYTMGEQFQESNVIRNRKGQFMVKVKPTLAKKPMDEKQAKQRGFPASRISPSYKKLSPERQAAYQAQYLQIAAALDQFDDQQDTVVLTRPKEGGEVEAMHTKSRIQNVHWDPSSTDVVGVVIDPTRAALSDESGVKLGESSFGLVTALGGSAPTAHRTKGYVEGVDENIGQFAQGWAEANRKGNTSSTARTFQQVQSGSQFLGSVAQTPKVQMAARFGEFVGDKGPEAEKIIGPHARKAAYRYRGVTKKPDADLKRDYEARLEADRAVDPLTGKGRLTPEQTAKVRTLQNRALTNRREQLAEKEGKSVHSVVIPKDEVAAIRNAAQIKALGQLPEVTPETAVGARLMVSERLMRQKKAPKGSKYNLQLHSGHTPPSEGVLINRHGRMVAQAHGYGDDHYLPFNMKQLGALRGGEYIRTRSVGGPTTEDIYTGLVGGAQALTVTSRSGTFMVEFEDDFKGTRRHNDKARRMVDRYGKLLDAVESGQVERTKELPWQIKDQIRREVDEEVGDSRFTTPKARKKMYEQAYEDYRRQGSDWNDTDAAAVRAAVEFHRAQNPDLTDAQIVDYEQDISGQIKRGKEVNFRLNALGYRDALEALQEQFPYYIKDVRWIPREGEKMRGSTTIDAGYVKPRHNRPAKAKAGYYDATIQGVQGVGEEKSGKINADRVDYQNFTEGVENARAERSAAGKDRGGADKEDEGGGTATKVAEKQPESTEAKAGLSEAATELYTGVRQVSGQVASIGTPEQLKAEIEREGSASARYQNLLRVINDPDNKKKLFDDGLLPDGAEMLAALDMARGVIARPYAGKADALTASEEPFVFEGPAYDINKATEIQVHREMESIADQPTTKGYELIDLDSDQTLKDEIARLARMDGKIKQAKKDADQVSSNPSSPEWQHAFSERLQGYEADNDVVRAAVNDPDVIPQLAENVQKMRRLRQVAKAKKMADLPPKGKRQRKTKPITTKQPDTDDDERPPAASGGGGAAAPSADAGPAGYQLAPRPWKSPEATLSSIDDVLGEPTKLVPKKKER